MKSELQKAKEASAKEKDKFAAWLFKKLQVSEYGTKKKLADYLGKDVGQVHKYSRGMSYPCGLTRNKIKLFFKK